MLRKIIIVLLSIITVLIFPIFFYNYGNVFNVSLELDNYISIVLGGLYGISLISVTIYSIVGNIIGQKTLNISPSTLLRYKIEIIFLPLYVLTLYIGLIIFVPSIYNNLSFVFLISIVIIFLISVQSSLILQPYYDVQQFNDTLIRMKFKILGRDSKKHSNSEFEKLIFNEFEEFISNYKEDKKSTYFGINDIKKIWLMYYEIRSDRKGEISNNFKMKMIEYAFLLLGDDFVELCDLIVDLDSLTVKYIIQNCLEDIYSENLYLFTFNKLYVLYNACKAATFPRRDFVDLFVEFGHISFTNSKYLNLLIKTLFDDRWNKKDAEYIAMYFRVCVNISSSTDLYSKIMEPNLSAKLKYVIDCYNDGRKFKKEYGDEFNSFLKTCIRIGEEE